MKARVARKKPAGRDRGRGRIPPEAFDFYFSLGAGRSYQAVAAKYGVSKQAITARATRERWQERLATVEAKARQSAEQKAVETLEAMSDRHLQSLRVIQGKALSALRSMSLASAMDAVRALDLSIKAERLIRGQPSDRQAVTVEEIVKREYEQWMEEDDADNRSTGALTAE